MGEDFDKIYKTGMVPGQRASEAISAHAQKGGAGAVEKALKKIIPRIEELEKDVKRLSALIKKHHAEKPKGDRDDRED